MKGSIGKSMATISVWGSVAVTAIFASNFVVLVAICAIFGTLTIWEILD